MRVFPTEALGADRRPGEIPRSQLPPMAGSYVFDENAVCFVPRFPFLDATSYTIAVDPVLVEPVLVTRSPVDVADFVHFSIGRTAPVRASTTSVVRVAPTTAIVPRNQLRLYVEFSAPMSEGQSVDHIQVRRADTGSELSDSLLSLDPELWSGDRRRLTVLFDPARIKRGLTPHQEAGYPLEEGTDIELVVDQGYRDARGASLAIGHVQRYRVGPDIRERVEPAAWTIRSPATGTTDALVVDFDRPLDRALLQRCLHVTDDRGRTVVGQLAVAVGEESWALHPDDAWRAAPYTLTVDAILEDQAGNSVARVFDRDLSIAAHDPRDAAHVARVFMPIAPDASHVTGD
jgi:hypothetical protein